MIGLYPWHLRSGGRRHVRPLLVAALALGGLLPSAAAVAQRFEPNYDENKVPAYTVPPIVDESTEAAANFQQAWQGRRAELWQLFAEQMYGLPPSSPVQLRCEKLESGSSCGDKALRQQWRVHLSTEQGSQTIELLVFTPTAAEKAVPCFLGLNFAGNHTVATDEQIPVTASWVRDTQASGAKEHQATAEGRGSSSSRWPVEQIVDAGLGVATAYYGDIDPDFDDDFHNGVHALFPEHRPSAEHPERWGSISAWAWGLSRLLDCLEQEVPQVDAGRVAVLGHSRLGKTALWAGASDPRFAMVVSNDSGCGGAALSRRAVGETVGRINTVFPHWFCPNFKQYNEREGSLPIDQHQLLALVAPRLLYVASASKDRWADPQGEFLSLNLASELYQRLEDARPSAGTAAPQGAGQPLRRVGYHLRDGQHDIDAWDWAHYIRFIQQL
ncbi:MAG: acetylxylan esterase [Planctomycetales bacterium]|nr:acetylxylan esterase [Planctomycetales bacterium]